MKPEDFHQQPFDSKKEEIAYFVREFLNYPGMHSSSMVIAKVEKATEENGRPDMHLALSDCSRKINFAFNIWTPEGRQNSRHKVEKLYQIIKGFRDHFHEEMDAFEIQLQEEGRDTPHDGFSDKL